MALIAAGGATDARQGYVACAASRSACKALRCGTFLDCELAQTMTDRLVPFEITVCGIEELGGYCAAGVSHVLSILDPGWPQPPAFGAFGEHERLELRFHDVIEVTAETIAPQPEHVERLLAFGRDVAAEVVNGAHLLVHCHAGISRSSASMALILAQARPDRPGADVLAEVQRIRPRAWPNLRIMELGDALLGRRGELVAAAYETYRRQLGRRPELVQEFVTAGRAREVVGALGDVAPDR